MLENASADQSAGGSQAFGGRLGRGFRLGLCVSGCWLPVILLTVNLAARLRGGRLTPKPTRAIRSRVDTPALASTAWRGTRAGRWQPPARSASGVWLSAILLAVNLTVAPAAADDHRPVAADRLEVGKIYIARTRVPIWFKADYRTLRLGSGHFPPGQHILKVLRRVRHEGVLYYRVKRIQPETLDRSRHIRVWTPAGALAGGTLHMIRY